MGFDGSSFFWLGSSVIHQPHLSFFVSLNNPIVLERERKRVLKFFAGFGVWTILGLRVCGVLSWYVIDCCLPELKEREREG